MTSSKTKGDQGEEFVNTIAYSTFLKYWCYPNPLDITKDNKEICDLLIVFNEICIIVSVKNYSFSGNYNKYFNKTIDKALRQLSGAERKLFGGREIIVKHPDRSAERFPKEQISEIFRVIVNTNVNVKFYQTSFCLNNNRYVTVFDAGAWQAMLDELNTISDVVSYLRERNRLVGNRPAIMLPREEYDFGKTDEVQLETEVEKLREEFKHRLALISGSEKDLIALYVVNVYQFPEKLYDASEPFLYIKADGMWERFQRSKLSTGKKEFESDGYFIDHLVRDLLIKIPNGDKISKALYRLDRFQRASFVKEFFKFHKEQIQKNPSPHLHRTNIVFDDLHFIFVYFDTTIPIMSEEVLYGFIDKSLHHRNYLMEYKCEEIVAIAFSQDLLSFGFGYISKDDPLSEEDKKEVEKSFRELGWKMRPE